MTDGSGNASRKGKASAEPKPAARYNHMMYGPTANEQRSVRKKVNLGGPYLQHPKFLGLMTAFKKGTAFRFEVTDKGRTFEVATDGSQILFDGKVLFYSRPCNRFEEHLLLDRSTVLQFQTTDALIHLAAAVMRSLPELEARPLTSINQQVYYGADPMDADLEKHGPNMLVGAYRHAKATERARP